MLAHKWTHPMTIMAGLRPVQLAYGQHSWPMASTAGLQLVQLILGRADVGTKRTMGWTR